MPLSVELSHFLSILLQFPVIHGRRPLDTAWMLAMPESAVRRMWAQLPPALTSTGVPLPVPGIPAHISGYDHQGKQSYLVHVNPMQ